MLMFSAWLFSLESAALRDLSEESVGGERSKLAE